VSLSWRERVVVALQPDAVHAVRLKSGERRSAPGTAAGAWQDALKDALAAWPRAEVTVVASNRLVRYAVVPLTAGVSGEAEEQSLARHHFNKVYGDRAREWDVRYSRETGLASAVGKGLIGDLQQVISQGKSKLVSLQPYLMSAFNKLRPRVPAEGAWIVLPELQATCVALFAKNAWAGVSVSRMTGETVIERERLRMGSAQAPGTVLRQEADGFAMALSAA
jgi:hypothetical protein